LTWRRLLAIAPVLMLAVSLPSQMFLRCHMDGLVRTSCCCPAQSAAAAGQAGAPGREAAGAARFPTLREQACCDPEIMSGHGVPVADLNRVAAADMLPLPLALPLLLAVVESPALSQARAPGGHGPPLPHTRMVLLKQSFLI